MQKLYIIIISLVLTLFVGYSIFLAPSQTGVTSFSGGSVGSDILNLVTKLKTTSIDSSFFSSALFGSFKDYSIKTFPETQGRPNPFAPIGLDVSSQSASQSENR